MPVPALQRQASARSVDEDAEDYCFLGPRTSMAMDLGVCVSLRVLPESISAATSLVVGCRLNEEDRRN